VPGLRFVGVHIHIGSQITTPEPLRRAATTLVTLALELVDDGVPLRHIDIGGGLGIAYDGRPTMSQREYLTAAILPELRRGGIPVVLEPGRACSVTPAPLFPASSTSRPTRMDGASRSSMPG